MTVPTHFVRLVLWAASLAFAAVVFSILTAQHASAADAEPGLLDTVTSAEHQPGQDRSGLADLVGTVADPVQPVTRPAAEALTPVTAPLPKAVRPVTAPVEKAAAPVTKPVAAALTPVANRAVQPVTDVVAPVAKSVAKPVDRILAPVLAPVVAVVEPVVNDLLAPVTERVVAPLLGAVAPSIDQPEPTPSPLPAAASVIGANSEDASARGANTDGPNTAPYAAWSASPASSPGASRSVVSAPIDHPEAPLPAGAPSPAGAPLPTPGPNGQAGSSTTAADAAYATTAGSRRVLNQAHGVALRDHALFSTQAFQRPAVSPA